MIELKSCPFCGGEVHFDVQPYRLAIGIKHNDYCIIKGFTGFVHGYYKFNIMADEYKSILEAHKEQLAERWNIRKPDCINANHDAGGCLGYGKGRDDDDPIYPCMNCPEYTGNKTGDCDPLEC